jgi:hypothetical protein
MATCKVLNTQKGNRIPSGLKAERQHHVITHNPSSANPKETLYIKTCKNPEINGKTFYVPNSFDLSTDIILSGDASNSVVNNLGRNLISKLVVKWGTEHILQIDEYNVYSTFADLWLTKEERNDRVF